MTNEREDLITYIYDGHKDAFGVKGRHYDFDAMSLEDLRKEADYIERSIDETIAREKAEAKLAVEEFEHQVAETIRYGAGDRQTALRWMTQGEEFVWGQCVEHWVYNRGILFTDYGKNLVEELMGIVQFTEIAE